MEEYKIIEEIYQCIEDNGLMVTLKKLFGVGTIIQIPFSQKSCDASINDLNLSVRSFNCLMRTGNTTIGKVIDAMQKDELLKIRNLGKNSRAEIRVRVYEYGYNCLSAKERKEFVKKLLELNKDRYVEIK